MRFLATALCAFMVITILHITPSQAYTIPTDQDSDILTWHSFQAPPLMITQGEDQGAGIIDGVRDILQQSLNGYTHKDANLPYKRFLLYAEKGMNICTPYLFKTPKREKFLIFSNPVVIFPGFELIMHKDLYEQFDFAAAISLKDMFEKRHLRLATNKIRAYSKVIDPIVKKYDGRGLVSRHTGSTTLVFRLLTTHRADFMIDFPNRVLYWAKELGVDPYDYVTIPIKEDYINATSYVACPKTKWGQKVIDQVNNSLAQNVAKKIYGDVLKRWSHDYHQDELDELHDKLVELHKKGPQY